MRVMMINVEDDGEMFEELILIKDRSRRAKRRKATALKHRRTENILMSAHTPDDGSTPSDISKNQKKALRFAKDHYPDNVFRYIESKPVNVVLRAVELREAKQEAEYEELRSTFHKAVEDWQFLDWLFDGVEEDFIFD